MARTKQFNEQAVVDQAIALFTAKGYHGTSAQDLVDALGLSRSSLYDTFGDKHGLFLRALEQYGRQSTRALVDLLASSADFPATLRQLFDQLIQDNVAKGTQGGCLMTNTATDVDALSAAQASWCGRVLSR
ncbi:MAG: TetR/AcrR family transcriptional regulator [Hymenobacter sp.]